MRATNEGEAESQRLYNELYYCIDNEGSTVPPPTQSTAASETTPDAISETSPEVTDENTPEVTPEITPEELPSEEDPEEDLSGM